MSRNTRKSSRKRRSKRKASSQFQKQSRTMMILGALGLAALIYILLPDASAPEVEAARLEDQPSLGAEDASVTLVEFGDFTCSACRSWHQAGIVEDLLEMYGDDLRVEWRDFPIITSDSPKAAQAGQCAHDQGLFWEYLDRVYSEPGSSYTNGRVDDLRRYAAEVNLDMEAFNTCLDSNQHQRTVGYDLDAAYSLGLRGTPSFVVNGTPVIGANPDLLIETIEAALAGN